MDSNNQSAVEQGTHGLSLGMPLVQMSTLMHPSELHQSRAVDITHAIAAMQAEVAMLRAETLVLRMAVATELEHSRHLVDECRRVHTLVSTLVESNANDMALLHTQSYENNRDMLLRTSEIYTQLGLLSASTMSSLASLSDAITLIPSTYFWPRFRRRLSLILNSLRGRPRAI